MDIVFHDAGVSEHGKCVQSGLFRRRRKGKHDTHDRSFESGGDICFFQHRRRYVLLMHLSTASEKQGRHPEWCVWRMRRLLCELLVRLLLSHTDVSSIQYIRTGLQSVYPIRESNDVSLNSKERVKKRTNAFMIWFLSRYLRGPSAPEFCNVFFHIPHSLNFPCDCNRQCKWPPRGDGTQRVIKIPYHNAWKQREGSLVMNPRP